MGGTRGCWWTHAGKYPNRKENRAKATLKFNWDSVPKITRWRGIPRGQVDDLTERHPCPNSRSCRRFLQTDHRQEACHRGLCIFKEQKIRDFGKTNESEFAAWPWHVLVGWARQVGYEASKGHLLFRRGKEFILARFYSTRRLAELSQLRISDVLLASVAFVNISRPWLLRLLKQKCLEPKTYRSWSLLAAPMFANTGGCRQ